jgi:glycosyltransferase involved in cell wall biosynthesis
MRFSIVTPVFNGEKFLDQTILSVVSQAGLFTIRYHVQDGGSKYGTLDMLAAWQSHLARDFPVGCEGIEFSFASAPDRGLYDAINRGFEACGGASDAMAWINADDRFELGAFATVQEIFKSFPDIDWLAGRTTLIDEAGTILFLSPITPFPRKAIEAGIFDGRFAGPYFIQQEGTFWRSSLWKRQVALMRISGSPVILISGGALPSITNSLLPIRSWAAFASGRASSAQTWRHTRLRLTPPFLQMK